VRVLSRLRGPLPQRTLPALQLTLVRCGGAPGHPRFVRDPLRRATRSARLGALLASLLSGWRTAHPAPAPWSGWRAFRVITPNDVSVVVRRGNLDEPIPELCPADVLLGLIAADVALEHDVAVVGRANDLPPVLGQEVNEAGDLGEALGRVRHVFAQPSGIRALSAVGSIELIADRPENVDKDVSGRRRHAREFSRAPLRSGSRRRNLWRSRREHRS
jgi:hypothetical protein